MKCVNCSNIEFIELDDNFHQCKSCGYVNCHECGGTGAVGAPFSGSDPSCEACGGVGAFPPERVIQGDNLIDSIVAAMSKSKLSDDFDAAYKPIKTMIAYMLEKAVHEGATSETTRELNIVIAAACAVAVDALVIHYKLLVMLKVGSEKAELQTRGFIKTMLADFERKLKNEQENPGKD